MTMAECSLLATAAMARPKISSRTVWIISLLATLRIVSITAKPIPQTWNQGFPNWSNGASSGEPSAQMNNPQGVVSGGNWRPFLTGGNQQQFPNSWSNFQVPNSPNGWNVPGGSSWNRPPNFQGFFSQNTQQFRPGSSGWFSGTPNGGWNGAGQMNPPWNAGGQGNTPWTSVLQGGGGQMSSPWNNGSPTGGGQMNNPWNNGTPTGGGQLNSSGQMNSGDSQSFFPWFGNGRVLDTKTEAKPEDPK